ncbi:hypothetical protein KEM56_001039 [Ascosphaera pollenicola]|nr:hypothetical protein KEM56_001039 [Ascosphaera pollenicola]
MGDAGTSQDSAGAPAASASAEHLLILIPPGLSYSLDAIKEEFPEMKISTHDPSQGLPSKGFDAVIHNPFFTKESDVIITNVSGIHGPAMADWVVMNWLVHSRKYHLSYEQQKDHKWGTHAQWSDAYDHAGKTVGIIGYGSVGRQIGRVAKAMGMRVLVHNLSPRNTPKSKENRRYNIPHTGDPDGTIPDAWFSGAEKKDLHHFLSQGLDQVVVSVPLTPATTNMFSTEEFKVMSESRKPGHMAPHFSNISRGPVIDQDALAKSLEKGELRGAAIDVAVPEPLPADHPLWNAPNLTITPHASSIGKEYMDRSLDILRINLKKLRTGEPLINRYNRGRGY